MTNKEKRLLENFRLELIEELELHSPLDAVCIYYENINGIKYFTDYEIAITDYQKYLELIDDHIERNKFIKYVADEKQKGNTFEFYNIAYNDELIDLVTLKEATYIICDLFYEDLPKEAKAIWVNLWIRKMTPYRLAKELSSSRQFVHQFLNGIIPVPQKRLLEIATILKFDISEYKREKSEYLFKDL